MKYLGLNDIHIPTTSHWIPLLTAYVNISTEREIFRLETLVRFSKNNFS